MSSVPLKTVLLWHIEVITLVLSHLDIPSSGGASSTGVDVKIELVAFIRSRDPHVLASINSTNYWWDSSPRVSNSQGVSGAVSHEQPPFVGISSSSAAVIGHRTRYVKRVIINPDLANIGV